MTSMAQSYFIVFQKTTKQARKTKMENIPPYDGSLSIGHCPLWGRSPKAKSKEDRNEKKERQKEKHSK